MISSLAGELNNFAYYRGQCVTIESEPSRIHWGIAKEECDEIAKADRLLNDVYRLKLRSLGKAKQLSLRRSQRAWIKSTNRLCRLSEDGLINNEYSSECFATQAKQRVRYLTVLK